MVIYIGSGKELKRNNNYYGRYEEIDKNRYCTSGQLTLQSNEGKSKWNNKSNSDSSELILLVVGHRLALP